MIPTEPFLKTVSKRPTWRHTVIILSIEMGAHTLDAIHHETGIELNTLTEVLKDLESQLYITRTNQQYYRPTTRHAIIPPPGM